jgi:D-amino-acid oxidase
MFCIVLRTCFLVWFSGCSAVEILTLKIPDLSEENIVAYTTGLRPYRKTGIRLEAETVGNKVIIHNYGHGGSGISLSWGCAQDAIHIMKKHSPEASSVAVIGVGVIGFTTAYLLKDMGAVVVPDRSRLCKRVIRCR